MIRTALCLAAWFCLLIPIAAMADDCVECHRYETPLAVQDWQLSKHSGEEVGCADCHGEDHTSADDVDLATGPTADTCAGCHADQFDQFSRGKHAHAWTVMDAMPTTHALPMALADGMKGCGGCHKLGLKSDEKIAELKAAGSKFGHASCDACHTRHTFSVKEAQQPQACQTCHMGFDHPQWEMWSSSKHGVRFLLKQNGTLPENTPAPSCQTCHMPDGDHEVRTAWGFLAVRLPLSEDEVWKADQITILQALGVLDLEGNPTARLDVVKAVDLARLTKEDFDRERNKMLAICGDCHSGNFAKADGLPGSALLPRCPDLDRAGSLRNASQAPDAHVPGYFPRESGLCVVVLLERDGA